jgi:hypothetical protein
MAEISGLQSILSSMHKQYLAGNLPLEQYATGVSNLEQQSPEMFNMAVNTPIADPGSFSMDLPPSNKPELSNIDFTKSAPNTAVAVDKGQPADWENFSGLFNKT